MPKMPDDFYGRPNKFSFKDLLAMLFTVGFFYISFQALNSEQALELVKSWVALVAIVLGGYFGQEMVSEYNRRPR